MKYLFSSRFVLGLCSFFILHMVHAKALSAEASDIMIAVVGPMTGDNADFGNQLRRGATMAVDSINKDGGVLGRPLRLEVFDDACDPERAVSVARELAARKVVFVAGHFCSESSIPASKIYHEAGIIQITPASTSPALTDDAARQGWTNVFRTCGRDDQQGTFAGTWLAQRYQGKKVAIIYHESTYGTGLAKETKKSMNNSGLKEVMYQAIKDEDSGIEKIISELKNKNVDAIYYGGDYKIGSLLIRMIRKNKIEARFVSGDALLTPDYWTIAGSAGEGTLVTFAPDPRSFQEARDLLSILSGQGLDPGGYILYSYAAIQVWAAGVTAAQSIDPEKVASNIRGHEIKTILGNLHYDNKGDVENSKYVFYVWKNGRYLEW